MTEVYYPRLDAANTRTLEFAVSDGKHVWLESKDMLHTLTRPSKNSLVYRQMSILGGGETEKSINIREQHLHHGSRAQHSSNRSHLRRARRPLTLYRC